MSELKAQVSEEDCIHPMSDGRAIHCKHGDILNADGTTDENYESLWPTDSGAWVDRLVEFSTLLGPKEMLVLLTHRMFSLSLRLEENEKECQEMFEESARRDEAELNFIQHRPKEIQ